MYSTHIFLIKCVCLRAETKDKTDVDAALNYGCKNIPRCLKFSAI